MFLRVEAVLVPLLPFLGREIAEKLKKEEMTVPLVKQMTSSEIKTELGVNLSVA